MGERYRASGCGGGVALFLVVLLAVVLLVVLAPGCGTVVSREQRSICMGRVAQGCCTGGSPSRPVRHGRLLWGQAAEPRTRQNLLLKPI
jgi:hypothetical protein